MAYFPGLKLQITAWSQVQPKLLIIDNFCVQIDPCMMKSFGTSSYVELQ